MWGAYLHQFAWDHVATLTFRYAPSRGGAIREVLDRWIRRLARNAQHGIPAFYGLERGAGGRLHLHVLTAGTAVLTLAQLKQAWKAGQSKIKRYDATRGAAWYVTKGVLGRCGVDPIWSCPDLMDTWFRPLGLAAPRTARG